ncbi:protein AMN1 homolog isoform X2 [Bacillus rossius redtenbacheri]
MWYKVTKDLPHVVKDEILKRVMLRDKITDENFPYLVHPKVTRLDLGGCVTNEMLGTVRLCPELEDLCLGASVGAVGPELSSVVLASAFTTLHKLRSLVLTKLQSVTDDVIETVTSNCPLLALLDVAGCSRISNASLEAVKSLRLLYALNISHTKVTDEGMVPYLETRGSQLTELHVSGCHGLTEETSKAVSLRCKNLKYFSSASDFSFAEVRTALDGDSALKNLEYFAWNIV